MGQLHMWRLSTQAPTWRSSRWSVSSCRFLVQRRVTIRGGDLIIRRQPRYAGEVSILVRQAKAVARHWVIDEVSTWLVATGRTTHVLLVAGDVTRSLDTVSTFG